MKVLGLGQKRMVALQHPMRIGRTQSPAQQFLLLGFFITRRLYESELSSAPRNKKAHAISVGFVTPSGFKPETF
ncbi:MAG: hypothetical protein ACKO52_08695 [Sediminibacterium sp.]